MQMFPHGIVHELIRITLKVVATLASIIMILSAIAYMMDWHWSRFILSMRNDVVFDKLYWNTAFKDEKESSDCWRCAMVSDLQRNVLPPGTNMTKVIDELGQGQKLDSKPCFTYPLSDKAFSELALYICYTNEQKVKNIYIHY